MIAIEKPIDLDTRRALPKDRATLADAPVCPNCGRRLRAINTCRLFTRYYPQCGCSKAQPVKRLRRIAWSKVDTITRIRLGR